MIPNANLRELRAQATRWAYIQDWKTHAERQNLEARRYGELIVINALECVRDVLRDEFSDLNYTAATQIQNRIKEYFGVEE